MDEVSNRSTFDRWKLCSAGAIAVLVVLLLAGSVVSGATADQTESAGAELRSGDSSQQFEILDLEPSSVELDAPQNVTVTVTLVNRAGTGRSTVEQVDLRMNGSTVTSRVIDLDSGERRDVELTVPATELQSGEYYVFSIWTETDATTGTIRVAATPTPDPTPTPTPEQSPTPTPTPTPESTATETPDGDESGVGFGVLVAIGALVVLAILAGRRGRP